MLPLRPPSRAASVARAAGRRPVDRIEGVLRDLLPRLLPDDDPASRGRGRPAILPGALLWTGLLVGILHGAAAQADLHRQFATAGLWHWPRLTISADAIRHRLLRQGPTVLARLFADVTAELLATTPPNRSLAPFATEVVVIDESTLDPIARLLPDLHGLRRGDVRLLPGRLVGLFDVRRQLWRLIALRDDPRQNEKVAARDLVATLAPGTLVLADLGSFGFAWFDELTDRGLWWVSRLRSGTSFEVMHTLAHEGETTDELIFLGTHRSDQTGRLVRRVAYRHGDRVHQYVTNVLDPAVLSTEAVVDLSGRRWDIELALKLVKRELGLAHLGMARWEAVQTQVWGAQCHAVCVRTLRRLWSRLVAYASLPTMPTPGPRSSVGVGAGRSPPGRDQRGRKNRPYTNCTALRVWGGGW